MTAIGRRRLPAALLGVVAALTIGLVGFGTAAAVQADPPQNAYYQEIRNAIAAKAIAENKKPSKETTDHGTNHFPARYKLKNVVRPAEWCGVFVNYVWAKGGATKRPSMKGKSVDQGHWATYWQKWGKSNKRWKSISKRNPAKGDAIVYGNYPESVHVGVVVAVKYDRKGKATHVKTVEGNIGDNVKSPTYNGSTWRPINQLTGRGKKASGFVSPVPLPW